MDQPAAIPNEAVPPLLAAPRGQSPAFFHPVWLTVAAVALAGGAQLVVRWRLPMPQCMLRKFTGLPCPTCGCTRSLLAWSHLEPAAAFRFNPLFSLLLTGLVAWLIAWGIERATGRAWLCRWRARTARWPLGKIFIALAVVNWLYLCLTLPR